MENLKNEQIDTSEETEYSEKVTMEANSDEIEPVTMCHLICIVWGLCLYFVDIIFDIIAAIEIHDSESSGFFAAAVIFIFLPAIITNLISWLCYQDDNNTAWQLKVAHIFLFGQIKRMFDLLYYALQLFQGKIRLTKDAMNKFSHWYADVAMIGMMDALLESDPQAIIQLSRIIPGNSEENFNFGVKRTLSAAASFISVGFSIASYHAIIRMPQSQKKLISLKGRICHFIWHVLITASRVISMACLVTVHPYAALILGIIHVALALIALCFPDIAPERKLSSFWSNLGLYLLIAFAYLFYAIPVRDGPSRKFYICMYTVFFVENVASVTYWYLQLQNHLAFIVSVITICCFLVGIFFMLMYYKCFHPTKMVSDEKHSCNYSLTQQNEVLDVESVKD